MIWWRSIEVGLILSELSRCHLDEKWLKEYAERFRNIYCDGYQQRYSEIMEMLKGMPSDDDADSRDDEAEDRPEVISANFVDLRECLGCSVEAMANRCIQACSSSRIMLFSILHRHDRRPRESNIAAGSLSMLRTARVRCLQALMATMR